MNTIQHSRRILTSATATALLVALGTLPATARQDPGEAHGRSTASCFCALERVGSQFVACDNLTGNGVPAPAWVPER
ncbi:hypothetical protein GCM10025782_35900 [Pedococcus ginsenosidimutans]|uniref:Uncharacterized protein n=1 Tax=Pedococcus ginsenosidimutans TaxID=490570 RepID=A0ABP8YKZ1_9MICO